MARVVTAAIWIKGGEVLVARRAPGQSHAGKWEFPGGKLEEGESERACLERELREELGVVGTAGAHLCDSLYKYEQGEILLRAYEYVGRGEVLRLAVHDQVEWADAEMVEGLDMTPADQPIARRVIERLKGES